MAELFIELFSEEIPAKLQIDAREKIIKIINENLQKRDINFGTSKSYSTPKRLVFVIDDVPENIEQKKRILKGPKTSAPQSALEGFIKTNSLNQSDVIKKILKKVNFTLLKLNQKKSMFLENYNHSFQNLSKAIHGKNQ